MLEYRTPVFSRQMFNACFTAGVFFNQMEDEGVKNNVLLRKKHCSNLLVFKNTLKVQTFCILTATSCCLI